jgi:hypothetical protein
MGVSELFRSFLLEGVYADGWIAMELPLEQGLRLEKRLFQQLFATQDQKEGECWGSTQLSRTVYRSHSPLML